MACKDAFCQEEGDGDSDASRFYSDPLVLFVFGGLVSAPPPSSVSVRGAETSPQLSTPNNVCLFSPEVKISSSFFVHFSVKKISAQPRKDEKIYPENFTRILDRLLDGYDNRLRPGFGGLYGKSRQCT